MALSLTTAPAAEPVSLDDAKAHLRVTHTAEDDYLETQVIPAARRHVENITHRALINQTWTLRLSQGFGTEIIRLPRPPLSSVSSVTYLDSNGDSQTWAASKYTVETPSGDLAPHGSIQPAYNEVYPTTRVHQDVVTITFVAGYGAAASNVPVGLVVGLMAMIEAVYVHRQGIPDEVWGQLEGVLSPFIAWREDLRYD